MWLRFRPKITKKIRIDQLKHGKLHLKFAFLWVLGRFWGGGGQFELYVEVMKEKGREGLLHFVVTPSMNICANETKKRGTAR